MDQLGAGIHGLVRSAVHLLDEGCDAGCHVGFLSGAGGLSLRQVRCLGARRLAATSTAPSGPRAMGLAPVRPSPRRSRGPDRWATRRIERLVWRRRPYVLSAMVVAGAERPVVLLGLDEGHGVGSASHRGPMELNAVVFPEADGTDLVGAGHLVEDEMPAARTREWAAHRRSVDDDSPASPLGFRGHSGHALRERCVSGRGSIRWIKRHARKQCRAPDQARQDTACNHGTTGYDLAGPCNA